jgi:predicted translin family RNA/ssDNA-binding protein
MESTNFSKLGGKVITSVTVKKSEHFQKFLTEMHNSFRMVQSESESYSKGHTEHSELLDNINHEYLQFTTIKNVITGLNVK